MEAFEEEIKQVRNYLTKKELPPNEDKQAIKNFNRKVSLFFLLAS